MRFRLAFAECEIGAALIAEVVAVRMFWGIGFGPLAWVGQAGEKWSFTIPQHGHMNQCEEVVGVCEEERFECIGEEACGDEFIVCLRDDP